MTKKEIAIKKIREKLPLIEKRATELFKIRLLSEAIKNEKGSDV
jgi:hypothetical protein